MLPISPQLPRIFILTLKHPRYRLRPWELSSTTPYLITLCFRGENDLGGYFRTRWGLNIRSKWQWHTEYRCSHAHRNSLPSVIRLLVEVMSEVYWAFLRSSRQSKSTAGVALLMNEPARLKLNWNWSSTCLCEIQDKCLYDGVKRPMTPRWRPMSSIHKKKPLPNAECP